MIDPIILLNNLKSFRVVESTIDIPDIMYHFTFVNRAYRILTENKLKTGNTVHGDKDVSVISLTTDPNYYKFKTRGVGTDIRFTLDAKAIHKDFGLFPHIDPYHPGEDEFCCSHTLNNFMKYFKAITIIKELEFIDNPSLGKLLNKMKIPYNFI